MECVISNYTSKRIVYIVHLTRYGNTFPLPNWANFGPLSCPLVRALENNMANGAGFHRCLLFETAKGSQLHVPDRRDEKKYYYCAEKRRKQIIV